MSKNEFETEFGRAVPQTRYAEYAGRYQARFLAQTQRLAATLSRAYEESGGARDLSEIAARMAAAGSPEMRDAWGTNLSIERAPWDRQNRNYTVSSAGPDKQFYSSDDLVTYLQVRDGAGVQFGRIANNSGSSTAEVNVEHDRGPVNGLAEIVGTVVDSSGAAIPGARVEARDASTGAIRATISGPEGRFDLAALPAGDRRVEIAATGFNVFSQRLTLKARDRAMLAVRMRSGRSDRANFRYRRGYAGANSIQRERQAAQCSPLTASPIWVPAAWAAWAAVGAAARPLTSP